MEKIELGFCAKTKVYKMIINALTEQKGCQINFTEKKSEKSFQIIVEVKEPEIRTDEDGSRWKKIG